ncbi:hypothetical protein [Lyticum sinuosum]|uniref:Uncharacterized protein n=1 Tax=Lyticum sinuosum TaxID=1332059 RepID=A0AAE5AHV8_9RICK|nr:hypothetical protein [Lyticum sinuosum]MDZ5761239.1 hypothetical protein [Lyticum sinuosum]
MNGTPGSNILSGIGGNFCGTETLGQSGKKSQDLTAPFNIDKIFDSAQQAGNAFGLPKLESIGISEQIKPPTTPINLDIKQNTIFGKAK